jgi:hypothetical protein
MDESAQLRTTRAIYDAVASDYARLLPDPRAKTHPERAVLAKFAALTPAGGLGPVADVRCGTGHVTAHLNQCAVDRPMTTEMG